MKGVVLAAGDGSRLGSLTAITPKPLVPVAGRPLISYTIEALARCGVRDVVVVVGYLGDAVQEELLAVADYPVRYTFVWNPDYHGGNALSLRCAAGAVGREPFLLTMADHMVSPALIKGLLAGAGGLNALAVDYGPKELACTAEATRVLVNGDDFVVAIGKHLDPWNGIDAGVFRFNPGIFSLLEAVPPAAELSAELSRLIEGGGLLRAVDVSGAFWLDVDTLPDLERAEGLARRHGDAVL